MGGSRKTAYAFWLSIGVLIANPAILDLLVEGPNAFLGNVKVDRLADFTAGVVSEQKSHIVSKILWPVIYCFVGFSLILNLSLFSIVRNAPPVLILFILYVLLSTFWSESPEWTAQRGLHLTGKVLVAYRLAQIFGLTEILTYVRDCLFIVVLVAALTAILLPEIGTQSYRGGTAWNGLYTHKTGLGHTAALCSLLCLHSFMTGAGRSALTMMYLALSLSVTALSQSATSYVALAAAVVIYIVAVKRGLSGATISQRKDAVILGSAFIAFGAIVAYAFVELILNILGRDITLSGRTDIWQGVLEMVKEKPALGYGFFAAWRSDQVAYVLERVWIWTPSAHNSYLQCLVDLGIVGLVLFLGYLFQTCINWGKCYIRYGGEFLLVTGISLGVLLFMGMLESSLFKGQQVNWFFWVLMSISLHNAKNSPRDIWVSAGEISAQSNAEDITDKTR